VTGATCAGPLVVASVVGLLWLNAWNVDQRDGLSLLERLRGGRPRAVRPPGPLWYVAEVHVTLRCRTCHAQLAETSASDTTLLELAACPMCGAR